MAETTAAATQQGAVSAAAPARAKARVLAVDDEESMRYFVGRGLRRLGYEVEVAASGAEAIAQFGAERFDAAVVDLKMPGADGIEVLGALRRHDPSAVVVLMTAFGTVRSAVDAMRRGAHDYVTKPFEIDELALSLERGLRQRALERENRELRRMLDTRTAYAGLIGQSPAMRAVFQTIDVLAESDSTVLITGESGTGKGLVARAIHAQSARRAGPFLALHCAALPNTLLENELFGHVPGAFTGATQHKRGLLARAAGGTLFLDEISEIPPPAQAKLERFLQEREFTPLGSAEPVRVDLRVIAAANKNLEEGVRDGWFRRELFWRLNVVPIALPPLRERREDIPALAAACLERHAAAKAARAKRLTVAATVALTQYDWPGNVRELENAIERIAVLSADRDVLDVKDLPAEINATAAREPLAPPASGVVALADAVAAFERVYFEKLARHTDGNVTEAARLAGLSRGHLHRKLRLLGIDAAAFRGGGAEHAG